MTGRKEQSSGYLQLDLDAERVIAERTVEDGLELGFGLRRLDLRTLLLCHSDVFPVFLCFLLLQVNF